MNLNLKNSGDVIIYQSEDGATKINVNLQDETVWLSQQQLVELYHASKSNISEHIKHIFEEGELQESSVIRKFRTTAKDGKSYLVTYYNLDMIISLGYRIKSSVATRTDAGSGTVHRTSGARLQTSRLSSQYLIISVT